MSFHTRFDVPSSFIGNSNEDNSDEESNFYGNMRRDEELFEPEEEDSDQMEKGFLPKEVEKEFSFSLERVDVEQFKSGTKMFISTPLCFIGVSTNWSIYRIFKSSPNGVDCTKDQKWHAIRLTETGSESNQDGIFGSIVGHGKAGIKGVSNFIKTNITMNKSETKIRVDKIFSDKKGFHTVFLSTETKGTWYLGLDMNEGEYSPFFKGKKIEAMSWGDMSEPHSAQNVLISLENELFLGNLKVETNESWGEKKNKLIETGKKIAATISDNISQHKWDLKSVMRFEEGDKVLEIMVNHSILAVSD